MKSKAVGRSIQGKDIQSLRKESAAFWRTALPQFDGDQKRDPRFSIDIAFKHLEWLSTIKLAIRTGNPTVRVFAIEELAKLEQRTPGFGDYFEEAYFCSKSVEEKIKIVSSITSISTLFNLYYMEIFTCNEEGLPSNLVGKFIEKIIKLVCSADLKKLSPEETRKAVDLFDQAYTLSIRLGNTQLVYACKRLFESLIDKITDPTPFEALLLDYNQNFQRTSSTTLSSPSFIEINFPFLPLILEVVKEGEMKALLPVLALLREGCPAKRNKIVRVLADMNYYESPQKGYIDHKGNFIDLNIH